MKTSNRLILCVLLGGFALGRLYAEPPVSRTTGKLLLLDNERTLEGDIEHIGAQYRVQRPTGETFVPAEKVVFLCNTLPEAYEYLRSQANLKDADERLRLARWCHLHGLRTQALTETTEADQLRPKHPETLRLLSNLQRTVPDKPAAFTAPPSPMPEPVPVLGGNSDVTAEALGQFNSKIQPILMNACSSCHSSGKGGAFRLTKSFEAGAGNRRTAQQNLTAVLAQVNLDKGSSFLQKAGTAHGGMTQTALKGRQATAFKTLEEWVRQAAATGSGVREVIVATPLPLPSTTEKIEPASVSAT